MKRRELEPLSEQRWSRVERDLFARLDAAGPLPAKVEPTRPFFIAAPAFVAGACLAALLTWQTAPEPQHRAGAQGLQIETNEDARKVHLAQVEIEAAPHSALIVEQGERPLVAVLYGSAEVHVASDAAATPLVVRAGALRMRAQFASFKVAMLGSEARVDVTEGAVEIARAERWLRLEAGQSYGDARPTPAQPAPPAASAISTDEASGKTQESVPAKQRGPARSPSQQARYEQAAQREATDPARALESYRELAKEGGAWAEHALFALGRLELERGHAEQGRAALGDYLARYPRGRNAEDARRLLQRQ